MNMSRIRIPIPITIRERRKRGWTKKRRVLFYFSHVFPLSLPIPKPYSILIFRTLSRRYIDFKKWRDIRLSV